MKINNKTGKKRIKITKSYNRLYSNIMKLFEDKDTYELIRNKIKKPKKVKNPTEKSIEREKIRLQKIRFYIKKDNIKKEAEENTDAKPKTETRGRKKGSKDTKKRKSRKGSPHKPTKFEKDISEKYPDIIFGSQKDYPEMSMFIIQRIQNLIDGNDTAGSMILLDWFMAELSNLGEEEFAKRTSKYESEVLEACNEIIFASEVEAIRFNLYNLATLVKGRPLTRNESIDLNDVVNSVWYFFATGNQSSEDLKDDYLDKDD